MSEMPKPIKYFALGGIPVLIFMFGLAFGKAGYDNLGLWCVAYLDINAILLFCYSILLLARRSKRKKASHL